MCGAVRYEIRGPIRDVIACHCEQCRRVSGHYVAATAANPKDLVITKDDRLAWYEGTKYIRRGFCQNCGSTLFFDHGDDYPTGVAAGSLDSSENVKLAAHIWTEEAGHYYDIADEAPRFTSIEWKDRSGWDPLRWTDGSDHLQGAKKFSEH
jgi:hypothetical protein